MPEPSIISPYSDFIAMESHISNLATRASVFLEFRGGKSRPIITDHKYLITEICFLRVLLAWENFLNEIFPRMLCGAPRLSAPHPRPRASFRQIEHTREVILSGKKFINWVDPAEVIKLADLYFNHGDPFATPFRAAYGNLESIKIIRNRIAHSSDKASKAFIKLIRDQYGYNPKNMSPGRYLLDTLPSVAPNNHYQYYTQVLLTVAQLVTG